MGSFKLRADADGIRPGIDINEELVSKQDKGGYTNYSYKFTVPATSNDSSAMTDVIFIGIQPSGATDGYVFGFSVYEDGDTNKTELYSNPDFKIGLDNWAYGWDAWFGTTTGSGTEKGLTEWSNNGTTLTIVDFDESLFGGGSVASGEKMLYFKSAAPKVLYQRIEAKVGKSYIYSFAASKSIGDFNIVATTDGIRNGITINEELVSEQEKLGYSVYTYKFTVPATSNDGSPMTDVIFIGMQPIAGADGYLFGFSVYEDGDANKTELYSNPDFKIGLDNWAYGWDAWFGTSTGSGTEKGLTEWSNNSATLKIVDYDESLLGKTDDTPKQMLYFVNGANTRQFGYRVKVEPSETYCLEFSLFSTSDTSLQVCENGLRATIAVENDVEVTTEENYKKYKYTFTMPDELKADTYFIGPQIYYYSEGYIFDMLLYKADDTKKKNMYPNAELKVGLDGWIWGWSAWFGSNTESGLKEWTDGIITLKLMDFDTAKIDALIALLTSNDGEWWSPDDLLEESDENIANVKGTLVDQNGKAMPDVKLEFISEENTLVTATDSKGEFEFANFEGGFYELYVIDSNGNRRNTGYFSNFFNGDEVTLKLVCDSSDIEVESEITNNDDSQSTDNTTDTEEAPKEEKSVGIIKGKVYTPQLKTVSDLKIFMRGVGETVTDKDGAFVFNDIPVGEYEVYTVLDDGKEYVFRTVDVKENVELSVKLKYDVSANASVEEEADFNFVWIIIPIVAVIVAAGVAVIIILKKKSAKK